MMRLVCLLAALAYLALLAAPTWASELTYSYVDIAVVGASADAAGTRPSPVPGQDVRADALEGDGLRVAGSLGIGRAFYAEAAFESAIIDVDATISSPFATAEASGNFDRVGTRVAVGYLREIADNLDVVAALSYEHVNYDFGSFAGESFDVEDRGTGAEIGVRWNPRPELELFVSGLASAVGAVDLGAGTLDDAAMLRTGMRWYFFEDLGLGLDYRSGDVQTLTLSMRFGFGDLRWRPD